MIIRVMIFMIGVSALHGTVSAVTSPHIAADFPSHKHWNGGHLPPRPVYKGSDSSLAQRIARWFWSPDSDDDYDEGGHRPVRLKVNGGPKPPQQSHQSPQMHQATQHHETQTSNQAPEKKAEQSKSIKGSSTNLFQFWAAPNQKQSSNTGYRYGAGRSKENCNPCNEFPWVPVARSLPVVPAILANHGNEQYSLTIPAVSLHYGPPNPNSQPSKPVPAYAPPPNPLKTPSQTFTSDFGGKPPPPPSTQITFSAPQKSRLPSMTYGIPIDIAKIPLTYASSSANKYPVQQSAYSSNVSKKVNAPSLIHPPIPFPALSHGALPPLHPPQPFSKVKNAGLSAYLLPPAAPPAKAADSSASSSMAHSQSLSSDHGDCGKCRPSSTYSVEDSVAASAQHQETSHKVQAASNSPNVEVMKSVPVAEYISSIEYPMQIVQAPIVDIHGLPQYLNLKFPTQSGQSFLQHSGHALFVNHALNTNDLSSDALNPSTPQPGDNIISASSFKNHLHVQGKSAGQIKSPTLSSTAKQETSSITTVSPRTTLHYSSVPDLLPPLQDPPQRFFNGYNTSSLEQQSNTLIDGVPPSSMQYLNPPPLTATQSTLNWISSSTISSGSQAHSPTPTNQPRYPSQRPFAPSSTQSSKKPKHIHQIIVPYTTRNVKGISNANEPGWTPVPPQARKVPQNNGSFRIEIPQLTKNNSYGDIHGLQVGSSQMIKSIPLSAIGSDNIGQLPGQLIGQIPGIEAGLTPELISQLLKLEDGNNQNSLRALAHPGDVHHVLAANLRALLRGEEDSVDFNRLQKNIDNWTAEGYKTNAPPENFHPLTTLSHLSPSKNIPEEYFTTPSIFTNTTSDDEIYETSGSQNHPVRSILGPHEKQNQESSSEDYNSWSLLDTRLKSTPVTTQAMPTVVETVSTTEVPNLKKPFITFHPQAIPFQSKNKPSSLGTSTERPVSSSTEQDATQSTSKAWEQLQVSISPLTKEKVYVVTPQPVQSGEPTSPADSTEQSTMSISSTRVDKTFSIETARRTTRYLHDGISSQKKIQTKGYTLKPSRSTIQYTSVRRPKGSLSTLKDSAENLDPNHRSNFGIKLSADTDANRKRRFQDDKGYFRFFPELMKASDIGEEAEIDQVRRVALELKKEAS